MSATRPGFPAQLEPVDDSTGTSWLDAQRGPKAGGDRARPAPPVTFSAGRVAGTSALADDPSVDGDPSADFVASADATEVAEHAVDPDAAAPLQRDDAERMTTVLKAVAHPARLQLISIVQAGEHGEACVSEMTAPLGLSQPAVSHHLKILVEAGLMQRVRRGNWAWYSFVPAALEAILEALKLL